MAQPFGATRRLGGASPPLVQRAVGSCAARDLADDLDRALDEAFAGPRVQSERRERGARPRYRSMTHVEARRGRYLISTDKERLDIGVVHGYLHRSYWAAGIPREVVERSIRGSLCFGLYEGEKQVGFARVITDEATFAYLGDVFVLEEHRGRGLGKWLVEVITTAPALQGLRRLLLATRDAHGLYAKLGFTPLSAPEMFMEIRNPNVYRSGG